METKAKPLIAVTMGGVDGDDARPARAQVNAAYIRAIDSAGGVPVLVAPQLSGAVVEALVGAASALVLTGGGDVDPARYGAKAHPKTTGVAADRDAAEVLAVTTALELDLPVLAICRGMQVLNVALGGTLHQHLPDVFGERVGHAQTEAGFTRDALTHDVRLEPGSCAATYLGSAEMRVNSMHHQGIARLGEGLKPVGWAPDRCIEAVEMPGKRFAVGVQWHPEELGATAEATRLFLALVAAANGFRT